MLTSWRSSKSFWLFLICAALLFRCDNTLAQLNETTTFATRAYGSNASLRVSAELQTTASRLFGNLRVTISTATAPSLADRNLTLIYYIADASHSSQHYAHYAPVQLAEGASQVTVDIPHEQPANFTWAIQVVEDGRVIDDPKSRGTVQDFFWAQNYNSQTSLSTIAIDTNSSFAQAIEQQRITALQELNQQLNTNLGIVNTNLSLGATHVVPLQEAPTDWRMYLSHRWVLPVEIVRRINEIRPEVAKALRDYVCSGGRIVFLNVQSSADVAQVEMLLSGGQTTPMSSWQSVLSQDPDNETELVREARQLDFRTKLESSIQAGDSEQYYALLSQWLEKDPVLSRRLLFGEIEITPNSPSSVSDTAFQRYYSRLGSVSEHPASENNDGNWFWRNLIAEVGKPPVWMFCAMVTLFGGVLGPGLLFLTARIGRRSLMIFLVPSLAMLAVSFIIVYNVVREGFDAYRRVTSVQFVAPNNQYGFVWSRQNYFTGLPSRDGFAIDRGVFARAIDSDAESNRYSYSDPKDGRPTRIIHKPGTEQWQGWQRARQQQQLLIGHPLAQVELPFRVERMSDSEIKITNLTAEPLPLIVLRGEDEDYYLLENLIKEQVVSEVDIATARADVARIIVDYRPEAPLDLYQGGTLFDVGRRRNSVSAAMPDVLNQVFNRYLSDKLELSPFEFVTFVADPGDIAIPLEGQASEQDLHVMVGAWSW